jgi:NAD(P)-dependent dehydrogenase (short-subunit alcohol dehydrogenase family)
MQCYFQNLIPIFRTLKKEVCENLVKNLKGKIAVITGGGGGIGRGIALAMSEEGAGIVVNDLSRDKKGIMAADRVVDEIKQSKGTAAANYDSVATMSGGMNIIKTAIDNFGRIDILVNCAGNFKAMPTVEMSENDWDSIMNVHVKGHLSCVKAALPFMIKQKSGRIINISSRAAFGHIAASLPYATAKTAILGFTSSLSIELKPFGITVNAVLPSAATNLFPGKEEAIRSDGFLFPESLEPYWIAPVVAYLATSQAKDVTGQFIYASGGDICIYDQPLQPLTYIHRTGKWTVNDITKVFSNPKIFPDTKMKKLDVINFKG